MVVLPAPAGGWRCFSAGRALGPVVRRFAARSAEYEETRQQGPCLPSAVPALMDWKRHEWPFAAEGIRGWSLFFTGQANGNCVGMAEQVAAALLLRDRAGITAESRIHPPPMPINTANDHAPGATPEAAVRC